MDQSKDFEQNNTVINEHASTELEDQLNDGLSIQEENKYRILVVAPDNEERHRLKGLLERESSTVVEFDTTPEALEHLQALTQPEDTQLISMLIVNWALSDTTLPKLVRHLQQAPFSQLPLIALTDSPCVEINEALLFLKHTAVIEKPIKTTDMLTILQKFLVQPSLATPNRNAESEYYSFLESNTLLELAIKNHNNDRDSGINREKAQLSTESMN